VSAIGFDSSSTTGSLPMTWPRKRSYVRGAVSEASTGAVSSRAGS
jgi:hypothetical protein